MFKPSSLILGFKDNPKSIAYLGFPKMTSFICSVEEPRENRNIFPRLIFGDTERNRCHSGPAGDFCIGPNFISIFLIDRNTFRI